MLKAEGKINVAVIENMMGWRHSGFNIYCGSAIWPHDEEGLEKLARYTIRASFSLKRMTYIPAGKTHLTERQKCYINQKTAKPQKTFDAIDWLAMLTTHIPDKNEQMVRYYGYYSNKSGGLRKKACRDNEVPALMDSDVSRKDFRKNWAFGAENIQC